MAEVGEPERLPPELEEKISRQIREGISLSIRWKLDLDDPRHGEVAAIHWRPGDPNPLAAIILKDVQDQPMPLDLDGQRFMIVRQDWPDGWNADT